MPQRLLAESLAILRAAALTPALSRADPFAKAFREVVPSLLLHEPFHEVLDGVKSLAFGSEILARIPALATVPGLVTHIHTIACTTLHGAELYTHPRIQLLLKTPVRLQTNP